jgi:DNA-binding transcriptional LysR family regulator
MNSLKGIASFVAVATAGSFAAAAKQQGVSAVAVSKNVATLERQLGVRLLQRTTRQLQLTAEGKSYLGQCLEPLRALEAAQVAVQKSSKALSGLVRVTSVAAFGVGFVLPLLAQFHALHPKIQVQLHLDDTVSDMVADGYHIGLRVGQPQDSSLVARPIAPLPFVVCASPAYLAAQGTPHGLPDLSQHDCLRWSRVGQADPMPWRLQGMTPELSRTLKGSLHVNDLSALVAAAVQHQGLVCVPLPLVMPYFRSGQLRPVLADCIRSDLGVYLHYPNRKNLPARTRALVEFLLDCLRREPDLQTDALSLVRPFLAGAPAPGTSR